MCLTVASPSFFNSLLGKKPTPGDSSRDLFIPKRWRSPTTFERVTYTTWKVDGATPMYWFIMALTNPPFGSCAIYFHYRVTKKDILTELPGTWWKKLVERIHQFFLPQTLSRHCCGPRGLSQVLGEAPGSTDTLDAILKVGRVWF